MKTWSAGDQLNASDLNNNFSEVIYFGGTGADGVLSISSGTTTQSIASTVTLVKNYSSISITGTGKLAFSNAHSAGSAVILKSTGNVTLTSSSAPMIDASALGGSGTSGTSTVSTFTNTSATNSIYMIKIGASSGATGSSPALQVAATIAHFCKYGFIGVGGGGTGGDGQSGTHTGGTGGTGGGALVIECGGSLNFTTSGGISVAGANGTNGSDSFASGGGGGGGGSCIILYNLLTAASGTITVTGGTGGGPGTGATGGGGGGSVAAQGSTGSGGNGGTGATGVSAVIPAVQF